MFIRRWGFSPHPKMCVNWIVILHSLMRIENLLKISKYEVQMIKEIAAAALNAFKRWTLRLVAAWMGLHGWGYTCMVNQSLSIMSNNKGFVYFLYLSVHYFFLLPHFYPLCSSFVFSFLDQLTGFFPLFFVFGVSYKKERRYDVWMLLCEELACAIKHSSYMEYLVSVWILAIDSVNIRGLSWLHMHVDMCCGFWQIHIHMHTQKGGIGIYLWGLWKFLRLDWIILGWQNIESRILSERIFPFAYSSIYFAFIYLWIYLWWLP